MNKANYRRAAYIRMSKDTAYAVWKEYYQLVKKKDRNNLAEVCYRERNENSDFSHMTENNLVSSQSSNIFAALNNVSRTILKKTTKVLAKALNLTCQLKQTNISTNLTCSLSLVIRSHKHTISNILSASYSLVLLTFFLKQFRLAEIYQKTKKKDKKKHSNQSAKSHTILNLVLTTLNT